MLCSQRLFTLVCVANAETKVSWSIRPSVLRVRKPSCVKKNVGLRHTNQLLIEEPMCGQMWHSIG